VAGATTIQRLSLEDMVDHSEVIVSGHVARTWASWDDRHRFIWTHSEVIAENVIKGNRADTVVVSEPGGSVDGMAMRIAGAPTYVAGEQVVLFLERLPNGYLRSIGMGQGKLRVSADGRVHITQSGANYVRSRKAIPGTTMESLEGLPAAQVQQRVMRLVEQSLRRQR
jgi:hypothetical protein